MTTPTENPTCKHCGQGKSDHRPANYNDGVTIGQFLVCPFATFEAETDSFGPKESEVTPVTDTTQPQLSERQQLHNRICQYFATGGLWNPDMALHDKVRELFMDIRDYLGRPVQQCDCAKLREALKVVEQNLDNPMSHGQLRREYIKPALATPCTAETNSLAGELNRNSVSGDSATGKSHGAGLDAQPASKQSTETAQPAENVVAQLTPAQEKLFQEYAKHLARVNLRRKGSGRRRPLADM